MATTLLNPVAVEKILKDKLNRDMRKAAEPVIAKALDEIEKVMRDRLASTIVSYLETYIEVDRYGRDLRIIVKHEHDTRGGGGLWYER